MLCQLTSKGASSTIHLEHPYAFSQSVDHFTRSRKLLGQLPLKFSWLIREIVDDGTDVCQVWFFVMVLRADRKLASCVDVESRVAQHLTVRGRLAKVAPQMARDLCLFVLVLLDAGDHRLVTLELAILDAYIGALHPTRGLITGHHTACAMPQ